MPSSTPITIFWFRRDLRLHDNAGFFNALKNHKKVLPLFIFDRDILDELEDRKDRRVEFIHQVITNLKESLQKNNSDIIVKYGKPLDIFKELTQKLSIKTVYTNHDYEPYAKERDKAVGDFLKKEQIEFHTFKDQCIFERKEILTNQEGVYSVFTPYSRKWKAKFEEEGLPEYPTEEYFNHLINKDNELIADLKIEKMISLEEMNFEAVGKDFPSKDFPEDIVKVYDQQRNFPAKKGTTRLSIHLRFGTVSIREMARRAEKLNETWLNELIWRDFYMIIFHT
jgi:deoxyribodipyrimidine photo-lyase